MEFRVLGPLEVTKDGQALVVASARQRALLALLVINANRVLSADRIIDELWGEEPPDSGAKAVVFHISKLRDALEPDRGKGEPGSVLVTEPAGYMLVTDPESIDAVRFERLAAEGHALLANDPAVALATLQGALSLWRGDPFADVTYESFAQTEIRRLEERRFRALEDRLEADLALDRPEVAIGELEALVSHHPLRERLRGLLMRALYRSGRQAEALRVYQEGRRVLAEELGIDPSPELRQLEELILRQAPELGPEPIPTSLRNPYKGLRPFGEQDAPDFFGREALVDRLADRLARVAGAGRILALVGPSGSGKSSVARAGLIPALRAGALPGSERWLITAMYPGSRPWEELESALVRVAAKPQPDLLEGLESDRHGLRRVVMRILPSDDSCLLLFIDQFEELFSLVEDTATRDRFLKAVLDATAAEHSRLLVLATLRADFLDRPLRHPEFAGRLRDGLEVITPLTRSELERAITSPARAVGVTFEPGLAGEIISDVADQPGTLPLLQYALTELFDGSRGHPLSRETYAAIGGVVDALGRRAEEVFLGLAPDAQEAARQLFLGLVTSGEGAQAVASRVRRIQLEALLGPEAPLQEVLDEFGCRGLLTFDRNPLGQPTVEVAHEALLTRWPRLCGWVDEQRDDLWARNRLHDAAQEWVQAGHDAGFLLSAGRLDLFASWAATTELQLTPTDREFLEASLAERRRREEADAARAAHESELEHRAARRLRALVAVFAAAAVVAAILTLVVLSQQRAARQEEAIASARELAAASIGALSDDPALSLSLAVEAARATAHRAYIVEEAMDALHWAVQESHIAYPTTDAPVAVRPAPDGPRGVFLLPPGELVRHAAAHAPRAFTDRECRTYLHQDSCPDPWTWDGDQLDVYTDDGLAPVERLAAVSLEGAVIRVAAPFAGDPGALLTGFTEETAVEVRWSSVSPGVDLEAQLGEGADLAVVSRPGLLSSLAEQAHIIDMSAFLDPAEIGTDPGGYLVELATGEEGRLHGVPWAVSVSSLIWYPVPEFEEAGYRIPETWDELITLSERMVADGRTPWCLGTDATGAAGAVATDWIEDLVLGSEGPQFYDRWAAHRGVTFESAATESAFRRFGEVAFGEGFVVSGRASITRIRRDWAVLPMFSEPPRCWLHRDGGEARAFWPRPDSAELAAFPFPPVDPEFRGAVTGRVYMIAVLHDRPEVRRFVEHLLTAEVANAIASSPPVAGMLPVRTVDPSRYADDTTRAQDALLRAALESGTFRVGASDLMHPDVGSGSFPQGLLTYLNFGNPSVAQVLADIEAGWP